MLCTSVLDALFFAFVFVFVFFFFPKPQWKPHERERERESAFIALVFVFVAAVFVQDSPRESSHGSAGSRARHRSHRRRADRR